MEINWRTIWGALLETYKGILQMQCLERLVASAHDLYLECLLVQRLETTPFIYVSQEPKVYTYEYLPDIFR